jgi:hypothetical protein
MTASDQLQPVVPAAWRAESGRLWYPPPAAQVREPEWRGRPDPARARAAIGDQLRKLAAWCQFGACIARYTDDQALGERDLHARAIAAGWRVDGLGRLACPRCQQVDSSFWTTAPLRLWTGPATPS